MNRMAREVAMYLRTYNRTAEGLKSAQASIDGFVNNVKTKYSGLITLAKQLVGPLSAVGAFQLGRGALDAADQMWTIHERTDASVESLSRLKYVATQTGAEFEGVATALKLSQKALVTLGADTDSAVSPFRALGLSVADLKKMAPEDAFLLIGDAISRLPSHAERTAVSMQVFGRAGADLIPMFAGGAAGLREMMAEADRLGITMSTSTAQGADATNDKLTTLKLSIDALVLNLTTGLLPALNLIAGAATPIGWVSTQVGKLNEAMDLIRLSFRGARLDVNQHAEAMRINAEQGAAAAEAYELRVKRILMSKATMVDALGIEAQWNEQLAKSAELMGYTPELWAKRQKEMEEAQKAAKALREKDAAEALRLAQETAQAEADLRAWMYESRSGRKAVDVGMTNEVAPKQEVMGPVITDAQIKAFEDSIVAPFDVFAELSESMKWQFSAAWDSIISTSMSGSEKWAAIMDGIKNVAWSTIGQVVQKWVWGEAVKLGATKATEIGASTAKAAGAVADTAATGVKVTNAAAETAANTGAAASGFFKAFSSIPFLGIALAIGAIGVMMKVMKGFHNGGLVTGAAGRDAIPAWVERDEFIMPADKTRQFLPQLEAMRQGRGAPLTVAGGGGNTYNMIVPTGSLILADNRMAMRRFVDAAYRMMAEGPQQTTIQGRAVSG